MKNETENIEKTDIQDEDVDIEKIENVEKIPNIVVQLLNIEGDVVLYDDVKWIKLKSKRYNLIIMKDYLPIIGELQGSIEIRREDENIKLEKIKGYFMHKHNIFKLFYSE